MVTTPIRVTMGLFPGKPHTLRYVCYFQHNELCVAFLNHNQLSLLWACHLHHTLSILTMYDVSRRYCKPKHLGSFVFTTHEWYLVQHTYIYSRVYNSCSWGAHFLGSTTQSSRGRESPGESGKPQTKGMHFLLRVKYLGKFISFIQNQTLV